MTTFYKNGVLAHADDTKNVTKNDTKKLTDRQRVLYESIPFGITDDDTKKEPITTSMLVKQTKTSTSTIKRDLKVLQELGLIEHVGPSNGGYWKRIK